MNTTEKPRIESGMSENQISAEEEPKIYLSNGKKRQIMKERFDNNEGSFKAFDAAEIVALRTAKQEIEEIIKTEIQDYSFEQKINILKNILFNLAAKINNKIAISQEQIDGYIDKKKRKLSDRFDKLQAAYETIDYLEKSGIFAYKIRTSGHDKNSHMTQEDLNKKENLVSYLNNLFSQSVYYVTPEGMTLRLKLFEIKSPRTKPADMLQPPMEQIFFNKTPVDYDDKILNERKKVVRVTDSIPEEGKFIFEIATPQFEKLMSSHEEISQETIESGVGTIDSQDGIYINIPEESTLHSGWRIVGVETLKDFSSKER